jgi:hypothetical protein
MPDASAVPLRRPGAGGLEPGDWGWWYPKLRTEHVTTAEAACVAGEIGSTPLFDLNSACSTFGMQMKFFPT